MLHVRHVTTKAQGSAQSGESGDSVNAECANFLAKSQRPLKAAIISMVIESYLRSHFSCWGISLLIPTSGDCRFSRFIRTTCGAKICPPKLTARGRPVCFQIDPITLIRIPESIYSFYPRRIGQYHLTDWRTSSTCTLFTINPGLRVWSVYTGVASPITCKA